MSEYERELHPSNKQQEIKRYTYHYCYLLQAYMYFENSTTDNYIVILFVIFSPKVHLN